jgi:GT2 family glycosyltransferase
MSEETKLPSVGVVAIGRNEGDRLRACLESTAGIGGRVVYVDSGSTDGSVEMARSMGVEVVELDLKIPFTAGRARNEGIDRLRQLDSNLKFVQVVDGDCEIQAGWIDLAEAALRADEHLAVVCGRRREKYPARSIYNRLCDIEWATPVGEAKSCGGDAMIRLSALSQVGGYNPAVIAGEEPEMCFRLREAGWKIARLDAEMTLHDAAMTRLKQWWRRNLRAGHAYAEGYAIHGKSAEKFRGREVQSIWFWAIVLPLLIAASARQWPWVSLVLLASYPLLMVRIFLGRRRGGLSRRDSGLYAFFVVLGKFPQAIGTIKYGLGRFFGRRSGVIEYKNPAAAAETMGQSK